MHTSQIKTFNAQKRGRICILSPIFLILKDSQLWMCKMMGHYINIIHKDKLGIDIEMKDNEQC